MYGGGSFGSFPFGSLITLFVDVFNDERDSEITGTADLSSERDSEITGVIVVPIKLEYRIVVLDENGDAIGEFESFNKLKFGKRLNNYGSAQFDVLVNDPKTSSLISLRRYTVEIYRKQGNVNQRVWAGEQAMRSGSLDNKGLGWVTIYCFTWLEMLNARFTSAEHRYDTIDAGDIAWDLIDRTQVQWETHDTGATLPGTAADTSGVGTIAWTTINNIKTVGSGDAYFEPDPPSGGVTHYAKCTNFGFSVPSDAVILGIKAEIFCLTEGDNISRYAYTSELKLVKAGSIQSTNVATDEKWPIDSYDTVEYGGLGEMWGETALTPSDVNNSGFGVALSATGVTGPDFSLPAGIDYLKVTVYYETPSSSDNGDFGITQGTIEATIDRDRTYYNQNIMEAIIALSNVLSGFDFEITDDKVFNVYSLMGSDKTDSVVLEYGKNIVSAKIDEDFIHPANRAIVLGEVVGQDELQRVERNDTDSQDDFKIREQVETESDVSELETLEDKGDAVLRKYSLPLLKVEMALVKGSDPSILDFNLGDLIRLVIVYGLYSIDEEYRVFEWEISYGDDNAEILTLVLGRFTFSHPTFS